MKILFVLFLFFGFQAQASGNKLFFTNVKSVSVMDSFTPANVDYAYSQNAITVLISTRVLRQEVGEKWENVKVDGRVNNVTYRVKIDPSNPRHLLCYQAALAAVPNKNHFMIAEVGGQLICSVSHKDILQGS